MIDDRNDPCCRHWDRTIPESGDAMMMMTVQQRRPDLRHRRWNDDDGTPGTTKRLRLLLLMLVLLGREDLLRSFYISLWWKYVTMSSCREYLLHGGGQRSAGGEQLHLHLHGHVR
jgi:hypothetical protein